MEKSKNLKTIRWAGIILLNILAVILVLVFVLPKFLTTDQIVRYANTQIPGKIEAHLIKLNWFGKQTIQGLKLYDPQGDQVLEVNEITINSLASLLFQKWASNLNLDLKGLKGNLLRHSEKASNLHQALGIDTLQERLPPFEVNLTDVNAIINPLRIELTGQFESKGKPGSLDLKVVREKGMFPESLKVLTGRAKGFPVELLEQVVSFQDPQLGKVLLMVLGDTLDVKLEQTDPHVIQFQAKSPRFLTTIYMNLSFEGITLAEPGKVSIQLTPEFLQILPELRDVQVSLSKPMTIEAVFDHLKVPLSFDFSQAEMHAHLNIENAFLIAGQKNESMTIHDVAASFGKLSTNPLYTLNFKGYISQQSATTKIDIELAFDDKFKDFNAKGSLDPFILKNLAEGYTLVLQNIKFNIQSKSLKESLFHFTANLAAQDNKLLEDILGSAAELEVEGLINSKNKTNFNIDKLSASLKSPKSQMNFNGTLNSGKIRVDHLFIGDAALIEMTIPWETNATKDMIHLSFQGQTALKGHPQKGNIRGQAELKNGQKSGDIAYSIELQASQMPMALIENYLNQKHLGSLFGALFDLKLQASNNGVTINIEGDQFDGTAQLKIDEFITLQHQDKPAIFHYALTPARFEVVRKIFEQTHAIALQSNSEMTALITNLKLPFKDENGKGELQANFNINQLKAWDKTTNQLLFFENLTGDMLSQDIASEIKFSLKAFQEDKNELIVNGEMDNIISENHQLNTASMSLKLQAHAKKLPASLLCELACMEKATRIKMEALLGPVLDAEIAIQLQKMNGPLKIELLGSNGFVQIDSQITDGILTLNKPFVAELTASPLLGASVLDEIIPVLSGMISAENSLQIVIDPKGFFCPINIQDIAQLQIEMMSVDLGKVNFSNQGQIGKILSVFKTKPQEVITVWFTPIYLEMQAGRIKLERFDMLAMNIFPLATWGSIDLPKDYIDMVIGLSGKSLQNATGLPTFGKNYIMQFPYRGPIGKAKVDKKKLAAKIAALTASLTGTPHGLAIGAVIGLASGSFTEEKAPSPTTSPFPWALQEEETNLEEQKKKSSKNPLKLIKKGSSNLINTLIK